MEDWQHHSLEEQVDLENLVLLPSDSNSNKGLNKYSCEIKEPFENNIVIDNTDHIEIKTEQIKSDEFSTIALNPEKTGCSKKAGNTENNRILEGKKQTQVVPSSKPREYKKEKFVSQEAWKIYLESTERVNGIDILQVKYPLKILPEKNATNAGQEQIQKQENDPFGKFFS